MLEELSKAEPMSGVKIEIKSGCRVLGEVLYSRSLDVDDGLSFAVGPKRVSALPEAPR
jgi:hypothetical protein